MALSALCASCERGTGPTIDLVSANVVTHELLIDVDTYVGRGVGLSDELERSENHGNEALLRVGKTPPQVTLLRANTSAIDDAVGTATLVSAQLSVWVTNATEPSANCASAYGLFSVLSPWDELHATYDCANDPTPGDASNADCPAANVWSWDGGDPALQPYVTTPIDSVACTTDPSGDVRLVFDVTSAVGAIAEGGVNNGWAILNLTTHETTLLAFESAESGRTPTLAITLATGAVFAPLEPVPGDVPQLDPSTPTHVLAAMRWLFDPEFSLQLGETRRAFDRDRAALLRGRVFHRDTGLPLAGIDVRVLGHPELRHTATRLTHDGLAATGNYELLVNGGGTVVLEYTRDGFLPVQRVIDVPWNSWIAVADIAMVPAPTSCVTASAGLLAGPTVTDARGTRTLGAYVPPGTVMTDGRTCVTAADCGAGWSCSSAQCTTDAFEVCVDEITRRPTTAPGGPSLSPLAAMPGELPATSSYTFAAGGTVRVGTTTIDRPRFLSPVALHVVMSTGSFVPMDAGTTVPVGVYDRTAASWRASTDGGVYTIDRSSGCSIVGGSLPAVPAGEAASMCANTSAYPDGALVWRAAVDHFSFLDLNWLILQLANAVSPDVDGGDGMGCTTAASGSVIHCESRALGEALPITSTPFALTYTSDHQRGRGQAFRVTVTPLPPDSTTVPTRAVVELLAAGQTIPLADGTTCATGTLCTEAQMRAPHTIVWNGEDSYGRRLVGPERAYVRVRFEYDGIAYRAPPSGGRSFGRPPSSDPSTELSASGTLTVVTSQGVTLGTVDDRVSGLGGWRIDAHHMYDPATGSLFFGRESGEAPTRSGT